VEGSCRDGLSRVAIPEEFGGAGAGISNSADAEEMGRALGAGAVFIHRLSGAEAILHAGSDAQISKNGALIASGDAIGTLALFEGKGNPSRQR